MIWSRTAFGALVAGAVLLAAPGAATAQDGTRLAVWQTPVPDTFIDSARIEVQGQGQGSGRGQGMRDGRRGGRADRNFGKVVDRQGTIDENLLVAGETVTVGAEVDGDVLAFGETVVVGDRIADDVLAAGRTVVVRGTVMGDVRAAGETVRPAAAISGDFMAAAQRVTVPADTTVGGDAWMAGERIAVNGAVAGDVHAAGRIIRLAGPIDGDVDLRGETITIERTARIAGDLVYRSHRDITIEPGAEIGGDTVFVRTDGPRHFIGGLFAAIAAFALAMLAGVFVLGALQILFFPRLAASAARQLADRPWLTLGIGFAVLLAGPVAIVLLATTVVGIPFTIVLASAYIIAVVAGKLAVAAALGRYGAGLLRWDSDASYLTRLAAFAAGFLALAVVALIPVAGPIVVSVATAAGMGALIVKAWEMRQGV